MCVCLFDLVGHNCFYYTSKPECAIPDDNFLSKYKFVHTFGHTAKYSSCAADEVPQMLDGKLALKYGGSGELDVMRDIAKAYQV
jgi:hypothetical protein